MIATFDDPPMSAPPFVLEPRHATDLRWYFTAYEADIGYSSSWDAVESALAAAEVRRGLERAEKGKAKKEKREEETLIPVKPSRSSVFVDPYPDGVMAAVQKGQWIREALYAIGSDNRAILHAAFGPTRGPTDENRMIRRKFGEVAEIVVILYAFETPTSLFAARSFLSGICGRSETTKTRPLLVTLGRRAERHFLLPAARAYVEAL